MAIEIVTKDDLQTFRLQLLGDIRQLFAAAAPQHQKQWLKNSDVRKMLKVSSNTVQRLRISGKLKSSKIGGVHYYLLKDVEDMLDSGIS